MKFDISKLKKIKDKANAKEEKEGINVVSEYSKLIFDTFCAKMDQKDFQRALEEYMASGYRNREVAILHIHCYNMPQKRRTLQYSFTIGDTNGGIPVCDITVKVEDLSLLIQLRTYQELEISNAIHERVSIKLEEYLTEFGLPVIKGKSKFYSQDMYIYIDMIKFLNEE